jgi:hypothetical protein
MKKGLILAGVVLAALFVMGMTVEGNNYPSTLSIEGKDLKLIGAGLREKWFFDVYSMGAYSETGSCDTEAIIQNDEVKYLRLDMLRDVSAEKMSNTIGESFEEHMPKNASAELKAQHKTFMGYFKDECKKKTVIEFTYVPGTGTHLKQNGKEMGPVLAGADFARVLWDIYFGEDTCCSGLKDDILESCKKK